MSKTKKDKQVRLEFIGNNANSVTGSCQLISYFDQSLNREVNILLELGMSQDGSKLDAYLTNTKLIEKIKAKEIDFVVIPHCHGDHSFLIPVLVRNNKFNGMIITTKENKEILPVMLSDSAWIIKNDINWLKKNRKIKNRNYVPYYKIEDVELIQDYIIDIPINEIINLTENLQIRLISNKHCLGSVSCELFFKINSRVHKLFYSSDIGNLENEYFINKKQIPPSNSNITIIESTYGERTKDLNYKKLRNQELELLEKTIIDTIMQEGDVLIPCFAFNRTPTMAIYIKNIIQKNKVLNNTNLIIDGTLANDLLNVYAKICEGEDKKNIDELLNWNKLVRIKDFKKTMKWINNKNTKKIIISSSGMMDAGRVKEWAKVILPNKKNCIIFNGYSVDGSLATKIKQQEETHQKTVKIDKSTVTMNCKVICLNSFSSHISRRDLINYVLQINTSDYICLVHGSTNAKLELAEDIAKRLEDDCVSTKIIIPKKNQIIYF